MLKALPALLLPMSPAPVRTAPSVVAPLPAIVLPAAVPAPTVPLPAVPTARQTLEAVQARLQAAPPDDARAGKAAGDRAFDASVELTHDAAPTLYDRGSLASSLESGRLSYGVELRSANPVTATTLAENRAVSALIVDADDTERGQSSALVKAVQHTNVAVMARFASADDPLLKPKLDEGLTGALLKDAGSLKDTLKFLKRLYVPPMGERSVGPADVTGYLSRADEFVARSNGVFVGGVVIGDARGAANIESIVKAKARGLKLVELDRAGLTVAQIERVERVVAAAGIPLAGRASSRAEALAMRARGYRHVWLASDHGAIVSALDAFDDVPADAREAARGTHPRDWLRAGKLGFLPFLTTPDLGLARILAGRAQALWIDAESGQFPLPEVRELLASLPPGSHAVVRTTRYDDPATLEYLRAGAAGVVAPQVSTAREAAAFVAAVKRENPDALAVVMIETKRGLENVEEIARVPGIDALFIGPHDLQLSMGLSTKKCPEFEAALARIEAAANAAGVPLGGLASSRSHAYRLRAKGYRFFAGILDQAALAARLRAALE